MEIKLKGRNMPRNEKGDVCFKTLWDEDRERRPCESYWDTSVLTTFAPDEVVELVNRAIYQLEYQRDSHRKRGIEQRARERLLREELKKQTGGK